MGVFISRGLFHTSANHYFLVAPPKNIDATFGIGDVVQTHFSNTYHVDKVDQRHCL